MGNVMMENIMYKDSLIITMLTLTFGIFDASAQCLEVNLDNIQKLACAQDMESFSGDMKYNSDQIQGGKCTVDLGIKKGIQAFFKGAKTYPTTEKVVQEGIFECQYTLPGEWKSALKIQQDNFVVTSTLKNRVSRGIVQTGLCPKINFDALEHLIKGDEMEVKMSVMAGGATLNWKLKGKIQTGFVFFKEKPPATPSQIEGKGSIVQPFIHTCTFDSKAIGRPVTLTGVQQK